MLSFLLISVVPIVLLGILSYKLSYNIARDGIVNSVSYSGNQLNEALTNRFKQMENASNAMQYYLYTLILQPSSSITEQLDKFSYLKNNISNLQYTFDFFNISIYTTPEFLFSNQGLTFFKIKELNKHGVSSEFLETHLNQLHWGLFKDLKEPFMTTGSSDPKTYISSYSAFKKQSAEDLEYVFFIDIDENEISKMLADSSPDPSVVSMLVDRDGTIISHIDRSRLGASIDKSMMGVIKSNSGKTVSFRDRQLIVNHNNVTDWYVVTDVPNEYIMDNVNVLVNILLIMLVIVIIAAVLAGLFISNNLSTKIRRMSKVMSSFTIQDANQKLIQLHIPIDPDKIYRDELDRLAFVFNAMVDKMDNNFDKLLEMSLHEENLRYQLLQAKINPHFLYNILESIKTCQSLGRIDDANAMLSRLAKFYRQILKKGDELISIQDELDIATLYLEMEKLSHNHAFAWTITKEHQIEHFLIPKFTLQPLLENCVRHGLSTTGRKLNIHISVQYIDEEIRIRIEDNGVGISQSRLEQIRETITAKTVDADLFYGISNVNVRLSKYAMNGKGLDLESEEGRGTVVIVSIQQMIPDETVW